MQKELQPLFERIKEEIGKRIQEVKEHSTRQKSLLEEKYNVTKEENIKELKESFKKKLDIEKRRIYTENFIEYNKKLEEIKNGLFYNVLELLKQQVLNLPKQEYIKLVQATLLRNLFWGEKNFVVFDKSNRLSKEDREKIIKQIEDKIFKLNKETKVEIKEDVSDNFDFGIKIFANKKNKSFTLETYLEAVKQDIEKKINELI